MMFIRIHILDIQTNNTLVDQRWIYMQKHLLSQDIFSQKK